MALYETLQEAFERGCSDIHLTTGKPGVIRDKGALVKLEQYGAITYDEIYGKWNTPVKIEKNQPIPNTLIPSIILDFGIVSSCLISLGAIFS